MDVGCGSGRDLSWLKGKGYRVLGFERSRGLAKLARKNTDVDVIEGDFEKFDFAKLDVDAALMSASLVHLPHDKLKSVLLNISKAVKPEGILLISVKEGTGKFTDNENRDFYLWKEESMQTVISSLSFETLKVEKNKSPLGTGETFLSFIVRKKDR